MRAVLYARVSTANKGQDWQAQIEELERVAAQRGWTIVGRFHDQASGAKDSRPGLNRSLELCRAGRVDVFAAVSADRMARSLMHLLRIVAELDALKVKIACPRDGGLIDTTTPNGMAFLQVRGVFAELERRFAADRVKEALATRRARGVRLGRPRSINYDLEPVARQMRADGKSWAEIAGELGGTAGAWSRRLGRADQAAGLVGGGGASSRAAGAGAGTAPPGAGV